MKNLLLALTALVLLAVVAGGGYALGRASERSSQDDVISDCKDVIALLQLVAETTSKPNTSTAYALPEDNRCDVDLDPAS